MGKLKNKETASEILIELEDLEILLNERIAELNKISVIPNQMTQQSKHAFIFYREIIQKVQKMARKIHD